MEDVFAKLVDLNHRRENSVLCIVTNTSGSVPRKAGAKMIVTGDGKIYGTVGGGKIEQLVIGKAMEMMGESMPQKMSLNLREDADMHCGGAVEVYLEPSMPGNELVIFGAGHVGTALANMALDFGFEVTLVDYRSELLSRLKSDKIKTIEAEFETAAANLETGTNTFLVVTTPSHSSDFGVTAILATRPSAYLGMIGSKKKVKQAIAYFSKEKSLAEDQISKIDMPIGIPFNAQTPQEVALSILARIIDVRNNRL